MPNVIFDRECGISEVREHDRQRAGLGAVASVFRQPGAALDLEINVEVNEIPGLRIPPLL